MLLFFSAQLNPLNKALEEKRQVFEGRIVDCWVGCIILLEYCEYSSYKLEILQDI